MRRASRMLLVSVAVMVFFSVEGMASVTGTVTDNQSNPVSGAEVTFTDESDSGQYVSTYTDEAGHYTIDLVTVVEEVVPEPFMLGQNYPNPFNPSTTIPFTLNAPSHVILHIYNIMGQRVTSLVDASMNAGTHTVMWNGTDDNGYHVSAGVYLYQLITGGHAETKKMLLLDGGNAGSNSHVSKNITQSYDYSSRTALKVSATEDRSYTVTITHETIVPYEENNVVVNDGDVKDFIVELDENNGLPTGLTLVTIPEVTEPYAMTANFSVTLSSYEISTTVITNAQYIEYLTEALVSGDISATTTTISGTTGDWTGQVYLNLEDSECRISYVEGVFIADENMENRPVVDITWYGAKAFAQYYGLDLPTEAEWQYAASGGEGYLYGTDDGTISSTKATYDRNVGDFTDVGSYPANPFGLFDMAGNVWEWCHDWYGSFPAGTEHDYTGASSGVSRLLRGGMWDYGAFYSRVDHRSIAVPTGGYYVGFRVVRRGGDQK